MRLFLLPLDRFACEESSGKRLGSVRGGFLENALVSMKLYPFCSEIVDERNSFFGKVAFLFFEEALRTKPKIIQYKIYLKFNLKTNFHPLDFRCLRSPESW